MVIAAFNWLIQYHMTVAYDSLDSLDWTMDYSKRTVDF